VGVPNELRIQRLRRAFRDRYGHAGAFVATAPGRVNVIGEHIDYNELSVLPMAIQRRVALVFRPRADETIRIANARRSFPDGRFALRPTIPPHPVGAWCNYVKAAAEELATGYGAHHGLDAIVDSTIPVAAGLSSSSALVIATALAIAHTNELEIPPLELAGRMAAAERYVGTQGGGMDQAISLLAQSGTASRIDFDPLRVTAVPIPPAWRFIVAHSLSAAEKSGRVQAVYNQRTRECREALARVAAHIGPAGSRPTYATLTATHAVEELVAVAESHLDGAPRRRFRHVVTEADRVRRAEMAMREGDLEALGAVLRDSQASLRDDYEVSTPDLERLVDFALEAGAAGARLTGAGMGGCAIALCTDDRLDEVMGMLERKFYGARAWSGALDDVLFVAEPSSGATVTSL